MKLHLRVRRCGGQNLRILTLRPGTGVAFATNRYHDTWHILSDFRGATLLAHLLWSLSYQRRPGTVVVLDAPFLRPNPFDADRSDPVVLVPEALTHLGSAGLRALRRWRGRMGPPDGTVRLHSQGLLLDPAFPPWHARPDAETIERRSGWLVLRAGPVDLRCLAQAALRLPRWVHDGSAYTDFADQDGEIQVFDDFHSRVSEAIRARSRAALPPRGRLLPDPRMEVWRRSDRSRRIRLRRQGRGPRTAA